MENLKIDKAVIIRLIVVALAVVNKIAISQGFALLPFSENDVYQFGSDILLVGAVLWTAWKNNSLTKDAIRADSMLEYYKKEVK